MRTFEAMRRRHEESLRRSDDMLEVMLAQVIAKIHNTSLGGCKQPIKPEDVMPSEWAKQAKAKQAAKADPQSSVKHVREQMQMLMALQAGRKA